MNHESSPMTLFHGVFTPVKRGILTLPGVNTASLNPARAGGISDPVLAIREAVE